MEEQLLRNSYSIFTGQLPQMPVSRKTLINTLNQYSYCLAEKDQAFKKALQESDILLPDGASIVASVKFLSGKKIKKIAGADIHQHLLQELYSKSGTCFDLGSSAKALQKIRERIAKEYP